MNKPFLIIHSPRRTRTRRELSQAHSVHPATLSAFHHAFPDRSNFSNNESLIALVQFIHAGRGFLIPSVWRELPQWQTVAKRQGQTILFYHATPGSDHRPPAVVAQAPLYLALIRS